MKKGKIKLALIAIILILVIVVGLLLTSANSTELKSIRSKAQLHAIYDGSNAQSGSEIAAMILGMPWSMIAMPRHHYYYTNDMVFDGATKVTESAVSVPDFSTNTKDYSKTNIQVENVDEADIIKTDGDYIYSLSNNNVIITDVNNPSDVKVVSSSQPTTGTPVDLILYGNKLVVISMANEYNGRSYYSYNSNTLVTIYDITDRANPKSLKNYTLYEPYYTSRCIDNKLYVISSGYLREDDDTEDVITYYTEDSVQKEIPLKNIKYFPKINTEMQTLISFVDLNDTSKDIAVNSYLIDINNAYVSENYIYLLDSEYDYNNAPPIKSLFTLKGAIGPFVYDDDDDDGYKTNIYKFKFEDDGHISYFKKAKINGQTINQFSLDEYNNNLRVALYDSSKGSKVAVFDENLQLIGESTYLAKGERMYSSRFIGDRAYLVTYLNTDPLFVIDLSDPTNPTLLGELHIPGYSSYLHPYDENHLIGIGMNSEEVVNRDSQGKVRSSYAVITGMKMALFDVSDVNNPKQISETLIGDRRTTSAILTNHKALLFSKEKELIAIPVNNYTNDFKFETSTESRDALIELYSTYDTNYVAEGYLVYNINTTDGFKLKGSITHEKPKVNNTYYYYNTYSRLLRGLYIDNNLFTVSENKIKVNNLSDLSLVDEIDIK